MFAIDIQRKVAFTEAEDPSIVTCEHTDTMTLLLPIGTTLRQAVELQAAISVGANLAHSPIMHCWGNDGATLVYVRLRLTDRAEDVGQVISVLHPDGKGDW